MLFRSNVAGQTILYLPPAPWRTSNDAMGGITVRLDPALLRHVGQSMAGPQVRAEHWRTLGSQPLMLQSDQPGLASRFAPMYRLMELINQLMLRHGRLHDVLRLDDLLLRQIVAILCPALLAEPEMPEAEPCVQIIDGLLDWLHANFDQPISLSELETRAHYSRRSLQYAFRKRFGCGPMQYLRRLRLWRARQRIMAEIERAHV